jgi:hypothetical protein
VKIDDDGDVARDDWWNSDSDKGKAFRKKLFDAVDTFTSNHAVYRDSLYVGGSDTVIHNQLAGLYSNLIVMMLVRRSMPDGQGGTSLSANTTGMTRTVRDRQRNDRWVNVGFGSFAPRVRPRVRACRRRYQRPRLARVAQQSGLEEHLHVVNLSSASA